MSIFIIVTAYLVSALICWYATREHLKEYEGDPDALHVMAVIFPICNTAIAFGLIVYFVFSIFNAKKFFRL